MSRLVVWSRFPGIFEESRTTRHYSHLRCIGGFAIHEARTGGYSDLVIYDPYVEDPDKDDWLVPPSEPQVPENSDLGLLMRAYPQFSFSPVKTLNKEDTLLVCYFSYFFKPDNFAKDLEGLRELVRGIDGYIYAESDAEPLFLEGSLRIFKQQQYYPHPECTLLAHLSRNTEDPLRKKIQKIYTASAGAYASEVARAFPEIEVRHKPFLMPKSDLPLVDAYSERKYDLVLMKWLKEWHVHLSKITTPTKILSLDNTGLLKKRAQAINGEGVHSLDLVPLRPGQRQHEIHNLLADCKMLATSALMDGPIFDWNTAKLFESYYGGCLSVLTYPNKYSEFLLEGLPKDLIVQEDWSLTRAISCLQSFSDKDYAESISQYRKNIERYIREDNYQPLF